MSRSYFEGRSHYAIYNEESSYGGGAVSSSKVISKLQNISYTFNNNLLISQGVGEGANATSVNYGNFDVSGNVTVKPTNSLHFLNFGSGSVSGVGSAANPYILIESDNVGYTGTFARTGVIEIGAKGTGNDKTYTLSGVTYNNWTLSGNQGEELQVTADFTAGSVAAGTSLTGATAGTVPTMVFLSGSVGWNNETLDCTAFSVSQAYTSNYPREVFNRFGKQPTKGVRRYNWTLTINKHFDDSAGVVSATELINDFFGEIDSPATSGTVPARDLTIDINTGERIVNVQLEKSTIGDWAENPSLEGGIVSVTVNGISLAGKTDGGNKSALRWWTV